MDFIEREIIIALQDKNLCKLERQKMTHVCGFLKSSELVLLDKWMKACESVDSLDKKVAIQNVTGSPTVYLH